jgi:hypothetical protein
MLHIYKVACRYDGIQKTSCQQETFNYDGSRSLLKGETMTVADKEKEWADRARRYLKAELKRGEVSYAELARRLNTKGFQETEASITSKLGRGTFAATFFLASLAEIGCEIVRLEDV